MKLSYAVRWAGTLSPLAPFVEFLKIQRQCYLWLSASRAHRRLLALGQSGWSFAVSLDLTRFFLETRQAYGEEHRLWGDKAYVQNLTLLLTGQV